MNSINEGWGDDLGVLNLSAPCARVFVNGRRGQSAGGTVQQWGSMGSWISGFGHCVTLLFVALILGFGMASIQAGETAPSEPQVKAAFLLNFPKYVAWPATAFAGTNAPVVIAIFDGDDIADEFSTMSAGKVIEGHPVKLVRVTSVEQCRDCHVLFIGSGQSRKLMEIFSKLPGSNILTVGESDDFIDKGGMINLARRERRIVLEVNMNATRQTELKISSKLLALATVKGGKK